MDSWIGTSDKNPRDRARQILNLGWDYEPSPTAREQENHWTKPMLLSLPLGRSGLPTTFSYPGLHRLASLSKDSCYGSV